MSFSIAFCNTFVMHLINLHKKTGESEVSYTTIYVEVSNFAYDRLKSQISMLKKLEIKIDDGPNRAN